MVIKFIKYTGRFPNLCSGVLTLEIDGQLWEFGNHYGEPYKDENGVMQSERFWRSGGSVSFDSEWNEEVTCEPWEVDEDELPKQLKEHASDLIDVFNSKRSIWVLWWMCIKYKGV